MRFRTLFPVVFDGDELSGGATPPAPEAAPEPAPVVIDGPWAKDLAEAFQDETVRGQVHEFLKGTVQPHVTRVEQESAPARALYDDLVADPDGTLAALVGQIYAETDDEPNEALATRFLEFISQGVEPEQAAAQVEAEQAAAPAPALAPEDREVIEDLKARKQQEKWLKAVEDKRAATGVDFEPEELAPFVVAADGDMDAAYDAMIAYRSRYGAPAPEAPAAPAAPATLGSAATGDAPAAPPTTRAYSFNELGDAMDDFLAERKAVTAPTTL